MSLTLSLPDCFLLGFLPTAPFFPELRDSGEGRGPRRETGVGLAEPSVLITTQVEEHWTQSGEPSWALVLDLLLVCCVTLGK